MEEKSNSIINKFTNILSRINTGEFISKIKNIKDSSKIIEISKNFCEIITNTKAQILFDISEEMHSLIKEKDNPINDDDNNNNMNLNDEVNNRLIKEIINTLPQIKFKIINLFSDIFELNSSLEIISGNLKKQKYSLAALRIEKLFKLRDNMYLKINSLKRIENNFSESLKIKTKTNYIENNIKKSKTHTKIIQFPKTPSPLWKNKNNISIIQSNKTNKNNFSSNKLLKHSLKKNVFPITKKKNDKPNISKYSESKYLNKNKISNQKLENKNERMNSKEKIIRTQKEIL